MKVASSSRVADLASHIWAGLYAFRAQAVVRNQAEVQLSRGAFVIKYPASRYGRMPRNFAGLSTLQRGHCLRICLRRGCHSHSLAWSENLHRAEKSQRTLKHRNDSRGKEDK